MIVSTMPNLARAAHVSAVRTSAPAQSGPAGVGGKIARVVTAREADDLARAATELVSTVTGLLDLAYQPALDS